MLAQRCNADLIDGLEIDGEAYEQCVTNFESSPWADRLFCYHASLKAYTNEMDIKYDFIISNPPFYSENFSTNDKLRNMARFEAAMPFNELLKSVIKLLSKNGRFCVIIPFKSEKKLVEIGKENTLFSDKILRIRGQKNSIIKRSLLSFSFEKKPVEINEIYLEEKRHIYSKEFINLTKEFYLKF